MPDDRGFYCLPDCPRFFRLMKTRNRRYPRSSRMDGDKSGESEAFLFSRRDPDFCDGRRSFPTNENSNMYRRGRLRWILLITNSLNGLAPVSLSCICEQISIFGALSIFAAKFNTERIWDRLLAIMRYYRQNMGRSAKSKIPDRLGFS